MALLLGGLLYIAFRPYTLLMFSWFEYLGMASVASEFRTLISPYSVFLPSWLVYSAPNGFWTLSFSATMALIWGKLRPSIAVIWSGLLWLVGIFSELMQALKILPGIFDFQDLLAYTLGFASVFLLLRMERK